MDYCKFCGSTDIQIRKIKYSTLESEGEEVSGGLPVLKAKINTNFGTVREVEDQDHGCNLCLNDRVRTTFEPEYLLEEGTERKIILIPETLNNALSKLQVTKNNLAKLLEAENSKFTKILDIFLKQGRNTCKEYRVGERVVLKMPRIEKLTLWVIVEMENGKEVYRLSFGGGDVICR